MDAMQEIIARRAFTSSYIALDSAFLVLFFVILLWKRRYMSAVVGLIMGLVYFAVDYGIFHLALGTRSISGAGMLSTLLWMSMSYGFTNFVWIWLALDRDEHLPEYTLLILLWWFCCPMLASLFPSQEIVIQRTTGAYHGAMALILFAGYLASIIWNLKEKERSCRFPLAWLLFVGIAVQAGWEVSLLLGGIRSAGLSSSAALQTLVVNSLLETNLGMPYVYAIFVSVTRRWNEDFSKRKVIPSFRERIKENRETKSPFFPQQH